MASCNYIFFYHPSGRKATNGVQIGQFTNGQIADPSFYTATSPELAAAAVFANYMKLNGTLQQFSTIVGDRFDTNQLSKVIKFT